MAGSKAYKLLLKQSEDLYFMDFGDDRKVEEVIAAARCKITESKLRDGGKNGKETSIGRKPDATLLSMGKGSEAAALNIEYREVAPGVVEQSEANVRLGEKLPNRNEGYTEKRRARNSFQINKKEWWRRGESEF